MPGLFHRQDDIGGDQNPHQSADEKCALREKRNNPIKSVLKIGVRDHMSLNPVNEGPTKTIL